VGVTQVAERYGVSRRSVHTWFATGTTVRSGWMSRASGARGRASAVCARRSAHLSCSWRGRLFPRPRRGPDARPGRRGDGHDRRQRHGRSVGGVAEKVVGSRAPRSSWCPRGRRPTPARAPAAPASCGGHLRPGADRSPAESV